MPFAAGLVSSPPSAELIRTGVRLILQLVENLFRAVAHWGPSSLRAITGHTPCVLFALSFDEPSGATRRVFSARADSLERQENIVQERVGPQAIFRKPTPALADMGNSPPLLRASYAAQVE